MNRQDAAIRQFCSDFLVGTSKLEERCLLLAAWCAVCTQTDNTAPSDLATMLETRRGPAGGRVRLFVEMVKCAGGEATLFGIFGGMRRNTVVEVRTNGRTWFVDPLIGCVCRIEGQLASYADMHASPEHAEAGMELLQLAAEDEPGVTESGERHQRLNNWYRAHHFRVMRTFGPLDGKTLLPFQLSFDMSEFWHFPFFSSQLGSKVGFIECGRYLGVSVPNFFGAHDKKPAHVWNFANAEPPEDYEICYTFAPPTIKRGLVPSPRRIRLFARSSAAEILSGDLFEASPEDFSGADELTWVIRFRAQSDCPMVIVESDAERRGDAIPINSIGLRRVAGPLPLLGTSATPRVDHEILAHEGKLSTKPPQPLDRDSNRILQYLSESSVIQKKLSSNSFHPWPQRPYNFSWLAEAMAAVYAHRVTGDRRFADWVFNNFRKILAYRDKNTGVKDFSRGRIMNGWGGTVPLHRQGGILQWVNEVCTAGCMITPILVLIHDLQKNGSAALRYKDIIDEIVPLCREIIEDFFGEIFVDDSINGAYLVMPYDGTPEPTAHAAPFAAAMAAFYACSGEEEFLRRAEQFANFFMSSMTEDGSGFLSWPYRPVPGQMKGEGSYFFKARTALIFPIIANALGLVFSDYTMKKLAQSVVHYVLPDNGDIHIYISPDNREVLSKEKLIWFAEREMAGFLRQIIGYYPLTLFDPRLGERIDRAVSDWNILFPHGYFTLGIGVESYAVRLDPHKALKG